MSHSCAFPVLFVRPYSLKRPTARVAGKNGKPEGQADGTVLGVGGGATVAAEQENEKAAPGEVDGVAVPGELRAVADVTTRESPSGTAVGHSGSDDGSLKA